MGGNSTLFQGSVISAMGKAAARGQTLLRSPVVFQPVVQVPFPVRLCLRVFFQQYLVLVQQLSCSLLGSGRFRGRTFMQQGPPTFRAVLAYRPLQSSSSTCSFILAGGGLAVLLQHNILSFLYTPEGTNSDLQELSRTAPALRLVTGNWTQVDTPSVASQQEDGFFP